LRNGTGAGGVLLQQVALSPDDAVYGLAWCAANCAHGERLWCFLGRAIVACCNALPNDLDLTVETCCSALHQGNICRKTHLVDVTSGLQVVQGIKDNIKSPKPFDAELRVLDVRMVGHHLDIAVEF